MKFIGRLFTTSLTTLFHFLLIGYFFICDHRLEIIFLITLPFVLLVAYWAGKKFDKAIFHSHKDELTGVYNRRFVMNTFDKLTSLAERTNSKLFLLVIDCDNFKDINDKYGHVKGDMVLSLIGEILDSTIRKSDIVARWGGDEFVVIGHYKEETGVQTLIRRLEENLSKLSKQIEIPVVVSIGSATYPDDGSDLFDLIKIADKEMYSCKKTRKPK